MDRLQAMQVFTRVVEGGSFTKAADLLQLPRATVTTVIQDLEAHLGVRLLHRTTRRVNVTVDGAAYYERCVRLLGELEEVETSFSHSVDNPKGKLKIDVQSTLGRRVIVPALPAFHARYPGIQLEIGMTDRLVDLVEEGIDCVVRGGELRDSSLIARRIAVLEQINCAEAGYLERHGEPMTLDDLKNHLLVGYFSGRSPRTADWEYMDSGKKRFIKMNAIVSVNDAEAYVGCCLAGLGVAQLPRYGVAEYLAAGVLREVLPQWKPPQLPVSVVYPHNRHLPPKLRVFIDWVAELFERSPLLHRR